MTYELPWFDFSALIKYATDLVDADEVNLAIHALTKGMPGYYRDNPPKEVTELLNGLRAKMMTPHGYMTNVWDTHIPGEDYAIGMFNGTLRGSLIDADVKELSKDGTMVHVIDLGPGEYWLPIGLKARGYSFSYRDMGLMNEARAKAMELVGGHFQERAAVGQPTVFVACEIIEHLHHEQDIRVDYERAGGNANIIHISTPKYTYDLNPRPWKEKGDLGHLRTYTPQEFWNVVAGMFPEFEFQIYDHKVQHMRGVRRANLETV